MHKIRINLLYFAFVKDKTGVEFDLLDLPSDTSVKSLMKIILEKYPSLGNIIDMIQISVNYKIVDVDTILKDGDEIAFLPPISGG
ncbi:MAG TPA: molybdopterin converting factor subunit 1 [Candidatus Nitrosocosmicus sp.]|nr:molybdopterin converting factor subunit 1 [Candidatus Nitrosocosmicus sp.]